MTQEPSLVVEQDLPNQGNLLPGVFDLFFEGLRYIRNNIPLLLLLTAPMAIIEVINSLVRTGFSLSDPTVIVDPVTSLFSGVTNLIMFLVYIVFIGTALYLVTHQSQQVSYTTGFNWAKENFWRLIGISIISVFVIWGGLILFVIPGIIVGVYVALTQIVLVKEEKAGLAALLRSRDLVYGNWWSVFLVLLGLQLLYFLLMIIIGLILGVVGALIFSSAPIDLLTNLLFTVLGAGGTLILLNATWRIYTILSEQEKVRSSDFSVPAARTKYLMLAWLGPALMVASSALIYTMDSSSDTANKAATGAILLQAQIEAKMYHLEQAEPTYRGVCTKLKSMISESDIKQGAVKCNDDDQAFALTLQTANDTYCTDSTGYNKTIYTDLADRTQCLSI